MKLIKLVPLAALALALVSCNGPSKKESIDTKSTILNDSRVGYQIFVNTFANGDKSNDTLDSSGDILGIIDNLDYLKDNLNVDVLWLTPVHPSLSYHGYDVDDYKAIRDSFGGMEAYERLLSEAHKRDIKIMLDLVLNHTSKYHEWFIESKNKNPDYRDFYHWTKDRVTNDRYFENGDWYYAMFWDGMPDLNYDNPKTYDAMIDVCKYWIDKGVDGFRVDGARHIYNYDSTKGYEIYEGDDLAGINYQKTLSFFKKFNADLKEYNKDVFLTLEILETTAQSYYDYYGCGVDSTFDFETKDSIISAISATSGSNAPNFYQYILDEIKRKNPNGINSLVLSNHDMERIMSKLNNNPDRARAACTLEMLLPGISWIYNGDELGMSGKSLGSDHGDLGYRQPYKWGNKYDTDVIFMTSNRSNSYDEHNKKLASATEQLKDPNSLLSFYKVMTNYKSNIDAFSFGDFEPLTLEYSVSAFKRTYKNESYLVLINASNKKVSFNHEYANATIDFKYKNVEFSDSKATMDGNAIAVIKLNN